ncbi:MAG: DUF1292 domain-containing protein [Defluviitaleaceae bacterium]|nr:DUF1292 domain-containing protein [Defluviitaleaceae bacterium]
MDKLDDLLEFEDEDIIIVITDGDGNEHEYIVIDAISHKDCNYMLVTPVTYEEEEDSDTFEASIIKETGEEGDEVFYSLVDDDNEFNEVAALFMENDSDYGIEI